MYQRINAVKDLPLEEAILELDSIERQIKKNIEEIKNDTFISVAHLDPETCKNVHRLLLKETQRVRKLTLKNEM